MFSGIRKILGAIKVEQTETEIIISGIPAETMTRDIQKVWKTSRINIHMFTRNSKTQIAFPLFFAVDFYYMLDKMTEHRSRWTAIRTLTKIKTLLKSETWLRDTEVEHNARLDMKQLALFNYNPLPYQQSFYEAYDSLVPKFNLKGYLLAAAPGSGKTLMGFTLGECLHADRIVIFCPKIALYRVWESGVKSLYKKPPSYWIYDQGKPYNNEKIIIIHYEAISKTFDIAEKIKHLNVFVNLDESHHLNEITSQRGDHYLKWVETSGSTDRIWASGTAIKAMGSEMIPLLRTIDPLFTKDVEERFKKIYGRDGARGLDILQSRLGIISHVVEKHELGLDKPIMKRLPVIIPNGGKYTLTAIRNDMRDFITQRLRYYKDRYEQDRSFYDHCMSIHKGTLTSRIQKQTVERYEGYVRILPTLDLSLPTSKEIVIFCNSYELKTIVPTLPKDLRNEFKSVRSAIKYVHLKIQGEALGRVLGRKRIQCHIDMVPYVDFKGVCESTTKKTVVFTSFVEALEACDIFQKSIGMNPLLVYGKTNNELAKTVALFEKNEDLNPLNATYHSLSTAVPLVMADTMIMLNAPFRAYIHEQAISRIHRLGADTQTTIYEAYLDTGNEPNISTRSSDILAWSQDMVASILGTKSMYLHDDFTPSLEEVSMGDMDDNLIIEKILSKGFEDYGVEIDPNDFDITHVVKTRNPTYMGW